MSTYQKQVNGNGHRNGVSATGYTIYVPLNYNTGRRVEQDLLKWAQAEMLRFAGGMTEFAPSIGFWISPLGVVFHDEVLPVQVVIPSSLEAERWFIRFAGKLAVMLEQQSIFLVAQRLRCIESISPTLIANNSEERT